MATTDDLGAILLADFAAIRFEVTTFLSAELQFMSFRLLLVGVYAAAYARPIMRGVRYLQQKLRPQLEKLAGDFRILNSTFANPVRRADDRPRHTPVDAFSVPVRLLHCELDSWIENGQVTLARQLPFESPPSRPTHAALLLFALTPGVCGRHANCVLGARPPRGEMRNGAMWAIRNCVRITSGFRPTNDRPISGTHGAPRSCGRVVRRSGACSIRSSRRFMAGAFRENPGGTNYFRAQVRYLNRALPQLALAKGQCAELYYLKGTRWIPNNHTPLT